MMINPILLGLGVMALVGFLSLFLLQSKTNKTIRQMEQRLAVPPAQQWFTEALIAALPEPVQRYFLHAIAPGTPLASAVTLTMSGQFRLAQDKPWLPMQAQERLTRQGFIWKANIGSGLTQFQGADYYVDRIGRVQFALLGLIPVAQMQSPDTARSAIGRLAAELMWLPSALLPQHGVNWSATDDHTIHARLSVDNEPVTLTFVIDDHGKLLESAALRWGNQTPDRHWASIPMGGKCYAERTFGGFTIPSQVGAGWWFGSAQYFEFFQGTIEHAEF